MANALRKASLKPPQSHNPLLEPPISPITLNTTLVRSENILASPVENALVMMDIEGDQYFFSLEEIGTATWERLAEPILGAARASGLNEPAPSKPQARNNKHMFDAVSMISPGAHE